MPATALSNAPATAALPAGAPASAPASATLIRHDGGLRFNASIRGHQVPTDQSVKGGGEDTAPSPLELLNAALGGCVALYAHQFCLARGIDPTGLEVSVGTGFVPQPKRIGSFDVTVQLPAGFPEEYRAAMERAVRTCPVHNTLTHLPALAISLVDGA